MGIRVYPAIRVNQLFTLNKLLKALQSLRSPLPLLFFLTFLVATGWQCGDPEPPEPAEVEYNYEYFPLQEGAVIIYDVEHISIDGSGIPRIIDTSVYQIRQTVESTFTDLEGRTSYRIERERRATPQDPWTPEAVWYATQSANRVEMVEDNQRFVKMISPARHR